MMLMLTLTGDNGRVVDTLSSAALRCTPTTITLIEPDDTPLRTLAIDPDGYIRWETHMATDWSVAPSHPARALQLDCWNGTTWWRMGPLDTLNGTNDRFAARFCYEDLIDGPWSSGSINPAYLSFEGERYPIWTIRPWSNDWEWSTWAHRYAPIANPEPVRHGLASDDYCFGHDIRRLFERLPTDCCWKLVLIDGQPWLVPRLMDSGEPIGYLVTHIPNEHLNLRVRL